MKRKKRFFSRVTAVLPVLILGLFTLGLAEESELGVYDPHNAEVLYEGRNIGTVDLADPEIYGAIEAQPFSFRVVMPEVEGFVGGDEMDNTIGIGPAAYTVNGPRSQGANPPSYTDPDPYDSSDIYVDKAGNPIDPTDLGDGNIPSYFEEMPDIDFDELYPGSSDIDPSQWDVR